jgi:hypothetical protein
MTERGHPLRFGVVVPPMWRSWGEVLDLFTRAERAQEPGGLSSSE